MCEVELQCSGELRSVVSVVVNGHREGSVLGRTLRSILAAAEKAEQNGVVCKVTLILDRPDEATNCVAERFADQLAAIHKVDFGNLGKARAFGLSCVEGPWISFLDGDDLVSSNWIHQACRTAQSCFEPMNTIFHTELFVGFEAEVFFRCAMRTSDPEFHPLCLVADWFFCNNLFCHISIFQRIPVEGYDHSKGYGAEDWHWSCQTTYHGVQRDFVPETCYFYRVKPAHQSLGMAPGLLPKYTDLFSSISVQRLEETFVDRNKSEPMDVAFKPNLERLRRPVGGWLVGAALEQAKYDAQLAEVARFIRAHPEDAITFPPRTHYGAAQFYKLIGLRLKEADRHIALFWNTWAGAGGLAVFEALVAHVRLMYPDHIVVVFSDDDAVANISMERICHYQDIIFVDLCAAEDKYLIPSEYISIIVTRLFIQFNFDFIVNIGSKSFDCALSRYRRTFLHRCRTLHELIPSLEFDLIGTEAAVYLETCANRLGMDVAITTLSRRVAEMISVKSAGTLMPKFSASLRYSALEVAAAVREGDRQALRRAVSGLRFEQFLTSDEAATLSGGLQVATTFSSSVCAIIHISPGFEILALQARMAFKSVFSDGRVVFIGLNSALDSIRSIVPDLESECLAVECSSAQDAMRALALNGVGQCILIDANFMPSATFFETAKLHLRADGPASVGFPHSLIYPEGPIWYISELSGLVVSRLWEPSKWPSSLPKFGALVIRDLGAFQWICDEIPAALSADALTGVLACLALSLGEAEILLQTLAFSNHAQSDGQRQSRLILEAVQLLTSNHR